MEIKKPIMVAILCGAERNNWIAPDLFANLLKGITDAQRRGRLVVLELIYGIRPVDTARNEAVARFLKSECQWLLQIDNDTVPPANILGMIDAAQEDGKFIAAAPCPAIAPSGLVWVAGKRNSAGGWDFLNSSVLPNEWIPTDFVGTGCLAVRRCVFEALKPPYFQWNYAETMGAETMGEDFAFCLTAREAGFQVWLHGGYPCDHLHTVRFAGLMQCKN